MQLKIVLADPDIQYVDRLTAFINQNYNSRIRVISFSRSEPLAEYLNAGSHEVDIFLVSPAFSQLIGHPPDWIRSIVWLSGGDIIPNDKFPWINKLQPGDKLVAALIESFDERVRGVPAKFDKSTKTNIVGVYSPAGGVGKTSIALGLALALKGMGKEVFLLSVEVINTVVTALSVNGNEGLLKVLLSLGEKSSLLSLVMESFKTTDIMSSIDFFEPPECYTDLLDLEAEDLVKLVQGICSLDTYDYVVFDMEGGVSRANLTLLKACQKVILVSAPDVLANYKTRQFIGQLTTVEGDSVKKEEKFIRLMNKCRPQDMYDVREEYYKVPFCSDLWLPEGLKNKFDISGEFTGSLAPLIGSWFEEGLRC